ncbi:MAG: hypothetical protein SGCHY_005412 [Lobulomycetales sp.]
MFTFFAGKGILTFGMDLRGFGQTYKLQYEDLVNPNKSHNSDHPIMEGYSQFPTLLKDLHELERLSREYTERPLPTFLFGHSMGALVMLKYALADHEPRLRVDGIIAQSSAIRTINPIPPHIVTVLSVVSLVPRIGRYTHHTKLDLSDLSEAEAQEILENPLLHRMICLRLVKDIVDAQREIQARLDEYDMPMLIAHAENDKITSFNGSFEFFQKAPSRDKEFLRLENGTRHAIHLAKGKKDWLFEKYSSWILQRAAPPFDFSHHFPFSVFGIPPLN